MSRVFINLFVNVSTEFCSCNQLKLHRITDSYSRLSRILKQINIRKPKASVEDHRFRKAPMFLFKPTNDNTKIDYDPSKSKYDPMADACWNLNEKVPFIALAHTFSAIEEISGRLKSIEMMSNYMNSVILLSPNDLVKSIYLCLNKVAPDYEGIELGIGSSILMKALSEATGRNMTQLKKQMTDVGDIGLVAETSKSNQKLLIKPKALTVSDVFDSFEKIASMTGRNVQSKKVDLIKNLITCSKPIESRFIMRSLSGKMRIGLGEKSLILALTQAFMFYKNPELRRQTETEKFKDLLNHNSNILQTAFNECPNYSKLIPALLENGFENLSKSCYLSPGVPLKPMLAHPTKGVHEVFQRLEGLEFTCEYKYDGERAQIHFDEQNRILIYSRNQENNTEKYPDIVKLMPDVIKEGVKSFIIDCEAVAYDLANQQILPFQILSTRKRKNVEESEIKVNICLFAFDLIYLNGKSLVKCSLNDRRSLLRENFIFTDGKFMMAISKDLDEIDAIQEFLEESIKNKCEGLMIKTLQKDSSYEIAKRSFKWLKLKKDYLASVGDTIDLVPIGAYHGRGKRTGVFGGFLLACYDDKNDEFQSVCKIGTGFSDDDLANLSKSLQEFQISKPKSYFNVDDGSKPDIWFEPQQVWEIKCADFSISPVYKAGIGLVDPNKGISLRFPRFIKIRDDKKPEDSTTSSQIAQMYLNQENQIKLEQNNSRANENDDDDYVEMKENENNRGNNDDDYDDDEDGIIMKRRRRKEIDEFY
ncbi:small nuclear ribonucleoprotein component [Sarcoptes scabiei]|nr:small nuclear ribonucleoprotein component [Sarcoptes scabiei]